MAIFIAVWSGSRSEFSSGLAWPRVGYGICSTTATFNQLAEALQDQWYQILPLAGVVRTAPRESRMIAAGFYGPGLPHPGVEPTAAMCNKLLMHFGCKSSVSLFMRTSFELFLLELGLSFQPFHVEYAQHSELVTHSWMKMLWEKVWSFGIKVDVTDTEPGFARVGDCFLNRIFLDWNLPAEIHLRLNRV